MKSTTCITDYDFRLISPACHPGADIWSVKISFSKDISSLLPLLNAELENADYNHQAKVLVWKSGEKKYAFRPKEISVAPLRDREQAPAFCSEAVEIVNDIWQRKDEIEPDYTKRELPTVMELYKKLPRSNCGECGYPTCMAFAAALRTGKAPAEDCPSITSTNLSF